jgi:hypothetical protein
MIAFQRDCGLGGWPSGRPSVRQGRGGCGGEGGDGRDDEAGELAEAGETAGAGLSAVRPPRGGGGVAFES